MGLQLCFFVSAHQKANENNPKTFDILSKQPDELE